MPSVAGEPVLRWWIALSVAAGRAARNANGMITSANSMMAKPNTASACTAGDKVELISERTALRRQTHVGDDRLERRQPSFGTMAFRVGLSLIASIVGPGRWPPHHPKSDRRRTAAWCQLCRRLPAEQADRRGLLHRVAAR